MNKKNIISLFLRHPEFFIEIVSTRYSFTITQLKKYKDWLDWNKISNNININWTAEILNEFKDLIDWVDLSINENAFNDISHLETFSDTIDWDGRDDTSFDSIGSNEGVRWDLALIEKYESKLNFEKLSENRNVEWSEQLIDKYLPKWDLVELGSNDSIPWTVELFDKYLDLSYLSYYPIKWNKSLLSFEFIEKYKDSLEWWDISGNSKLPWREKNLLEYWSDNIDWGAIARNEALFINDKNFFSSNYDKWSADNFKEFSKLSANKYLPWSKEFIERYKIYWNWTDLCLNEGIPWDIELIKFFSKYVEWGGWYPCELYNGEGEVISAVGGEGFASGFVINEFLPWSIEFILHFEKNLDFRVLVMNDSVWDKAFKPFMDEDIIETVMRII